ncbi:MAG: hypothetical protein BGO38_07845 [Cellulomonas sp. 73-145]|nr:MAG: hypothetical protein BGO38_07845 [Cellulomonas sp. 73-145]
MRPSGGRGLTFLQPDDQEPELASPSDLPSPWADQETTSSGDQLGASPSEPGWPSDEPGEPSDGPRTSSRGSSASALSKRTLREAIRNGVLMAGSIAHQVLAREDAAAQVGLYLADEDDAQAIGDPVTNIVHRHGGLGAAGNPDVADAIAAMIGLALYAAKQAARFAAAHQLRAQSGTAPQETPDDPTAEVD